MASKEFYWDDKSSWASVGLATEFCKELAEALEQNSPEALKKLINILPRKKIVKFDINIQFAEEKFKRFDFDIEYK